MAEKNTESSTGPHHRARERERGTHLQPERIRRSPAYVVSMEGRKGEGDRVGIPLDSG
jgi:hypothetical protein